MHFILFIVLLVKLPTFKNKPRHDSIVVTLASANQKQEINTKEISLKQKEEVKQLESPKKKNQDIKQEKKNIEPTVPKKSTPPKKEDKEIVIKKDKKKEDIKKEPKKDKKKEDIKKEPKKDKKKEDIKKEDNLFDSVLKNLETDNKFSTNNTNSQIQNQQPSGNISAKEIDIIQSQVGHNWNKAAFIHTERQMECEFYVKTDMNCTIIDIKYKGSRYNDTLFAAFVKSVEKALWDTESFEGISRKSCMLMSNDYIEITFKHPE